jgi:hypothetical protein
VANEAIASSLPGAFMAQFLFMIFWKFSRYASPLSLQN